MISISSVRSIRSEDLSAGHCCHLYFSIYFEVEVVVAFLLDIYNYLILYSRLKSLMGGNLPSLMIVCS